jgi:integrase
MAKNKDINEKGLVFLKGALALGFKGRNREAIQTAIDTLSDTTRDLTDIHYKNLKPGTKLLDKLRHGFMARALKSHTNFIYRHSWNDKQVELVLGRYPELSLADARELWSKLRALRLDGRNPTEALNRAVSDKALTWGALTDKYIDLASEVKRSWHQDKQLLDRSIPNSWANRAVISITPRDIGDLLDAKRDTPRDREKLRTLLNAIFNLAMARGKRMKSWLASESAVVEPLVLLPANPVEGTSLPERKAETFIPQEKHVRAMLENLTCISHSDTRNAILLQLYTNSRIGEIAGLELEEIDLESHTWSLPSMKSKNGRHHKIALSEQAINIIKEQVEIHGETGLLFKSPNGRPLRNSTVSTAMLKNRKQLGIPEGYSTHANRHFGQTILAQLGCPVEVRDRISNHALSTTMSALYNHHQFDEEARNWTNKLSNYIEALAKGNAVVIDEARA